MKHAIRATGDEVLRGLSSENYTLTQREGLKLFRLAVWDENDPPFEHGAPASQELDWLFESQWIEFWATSEETAYDELCANLRAFHKAGLCRNDDNAEVFFHAPCVAWLEHYSTFDLLIIPEGSTKLEIIKIVLEFKIHCIYVLRKMCELVDKIIIECGSDFYHSVVE